MKPWTSWLLPQDETADQRQVRDGRETRAHGQVQLVRSRTNDAGLEASSRESGKLAKFDGTPADTHARPFTFLALELSEACQPPLLSSSASCAPDEMGTDREYESYPNEQKRDNECEGSTATGRKFDAPLSEKKNDRSTDSAPESH